MILLASLSVPVSLLPGCSSYQPTKEVWKGTKSLWYTYASPPASINYDDKGDLSAGATRLAQSMLSIDSELSRLERVMLNADRPPTNEWIQNFMINFPWIGGIAGVKYDGTILGQEPPVPQKELDYIPLLYEDAKQKRSALRGDVQITPQGPEVMLAAPLYESNSFLGIICAHFDLRTLSMQAENVDRLVVLSPQGLLWAGHYDFAQTPLAGLDWDKICRESTSGSCSNNNGKFLYQVRFLGNLPLVFAVAEEDSFPKGNGSVEQGLAFFPKERKKLPPPPQPETPPKAAGSVPAFGQPEEMVPDLPRPGGEEVATPVQEHVGGGRDSEDIEQGSRKSPLLRKQQRRRASRVQERSLEGENIRIEHTAPPQKPVQVKPDLDLGPDGNVPTLPGGRPSPFGAEDETPKPGTAAGKDVQGSDVKPAAPAPAPDAPAARKPAGEPGTLPGGRPNPFGSADDTDAKQNVPGSSGAGASNEAPGPSTRNEPSDAQKKSNPEPKNDSEKSPELLPGGRPNPFGS
ncbi:MAG: hypothetical protein K5657_09250 [Desulfovibrio sp.]|nr:hypothetical protein [Desulfovibrio sp.]